MQSEDQQRLVIQLLRQHQQQQQQSSKHKKHHGNQGPPTPPTIHAVRFRLPREPNAEQGGGIKAKLLPSGLRGNKNKDKASTGSRGREGILSHFRWPRSRSADRVTAMSRDTKQPEVKKPEAETSKRRTWFFSETSV